MPVIEMRDLRKVYRDRKKDEEVLAVSDFNLTIEEGEFIVLVGPSGCGKSTTLRMLAGLEDITGGELFINGRPANDMSPKERNMAMIFQDYALYPHMSVFKNMAYNLVLRKVPKQEIRQRVTDAAKTLDIDYLLNRKPRQLSGGQRQRVALGRAMVRFPTAFLLDEPLSNLDAKLRMELRLELNLLHKRLGSIFIYVTHDQTEAMMMGDRVVVMNEGNAQQVDTPGNLYSNPKNVFVAGFIGTPQMNFLPAVLGKDDVGFFAVYCGADIRIPGDMAERDVLERYTGRSVLLGIRPEHLLTSSGGPLSDDAIRAEVSAIDILGSEKLVHLKCSDDELIAKMPIGSYTKQGEIMVFSLMRDKLHLFDADTGNSLSRWRHVEF